MPNRAVIYLFDPATERRRPREVDRMARALARRGKTLYLIPHNHRDEPVAGDGVVVSPWLARSLAHQHHKETNS